MAEYDSVIAPGGSGKLVATLDTKGLNGLVVKGIGVSSNSAEKSAFSLYCGGLVTTDLDVYPSNRQSFGAVLQGETAEDELLLWASDGAGFVVKEVENKADFVEHELVSVPKEKGVYRLRVRLLPTTPVGIHTGVVQVETTHPKVKTLEISVHAQILTPIRTAPNYLSFQAAAGENAYVFVYPNGDNRFRILDVKAPAWIETSIEERPAEGGYVLDLTLREGSTPGKHTITIETDEPRQKILSIPFHVEPAPAG